MKSKLVDIATSNLRESYLQDAELALDDVIAIVGNPELARLRYSILHALAPEVENSEGDFSDINSSLLKCGLVETFLDGEIPFEKVAQLCGSRALLTASDAAQQHLDSVLDLRDKDAAKKVELPVRWGANWHRKHSKQYGILADTPPVIERGFQVGYSECARFFMIQLPRGHSEENAVTFPFSVALIIAHYSDQDVLRLIPVFKSKDYFKSSLELNSLRDKNIPSSIDCYEVCGENENVLERISVEMIEDLLKTGDVRVDEDLNRQIAALKQVILNQKKDDDA